MFYYLYVGANNDTKRVERAKVEGVLRKYADGFTVMPSTGYWKGEREDSVVVLINVNDVKKVAFDLKKELRQEAVAYQPAPALEFV